MTNDKANNDTLLVFQFLPFFTYFSLRGKKKLSQQWNLTQQLKQHKNKYGHNSMNLVGTM
jgi:hypothetical protein